MCGYLILLTLQTVLAASFRLWFFAETKWSSSFFLNVSLLEMINGYYAIMLQRKDPCCTLQKLLHTLNIPKSTMHSYLKKILCIICYNMWIPHILILKNMFAVSFRLWFFAETKWSSSFFKKAHYWRWEMGTIQ